MKTARIHADHMTEAELQAAIIALCKLLGYPVFHVRNSRGMAAGWPDLVILGHTRILYRELKTETGTLRPHQRQTGDAIRNAGGDWKVWRPRDWKANRIADELKLIGATPTLPFEAAS